MVETSVVSDSLKRVKCHHGDVVPIQGVGSRLCGARGRAGQGRTTWHTALMLWPSVLLLQVLGAACSGGGDGVLYRSLSLQVH